MLQIAADRCTVRNPDATVAARFFRRSRSSWTRTSRRRLRMLGAALKSPRWPHWRSAGRVLATRVP